MPGGIRTHWKAVPLHGAPRFALLSTLSRRGEFMYAGPKRPKLVWPEGQRRIPLVIARQVDVFPAQRRQMGEISGGRMVPLLSQVIDGRCR